MTVNFDRFQAVSFTYPHSTEIITFGTKPPFIVANIFIALQPLYVKVWICLLASLFACFLLGQLFDHIPIPKHNKHFFMLCIYVLFRQNINSFSTMSKSQNLWLNVIWNISSFVITSAYAGCLYSMISIPTKSETITTVQELSDAAIDKEILIVGTNQSAYITEIKVSIDGFYFRLLCNKSHCVLNCRNKNPNCILNWLM